ncbi:MAG: HDIG domain-containing metalloprotein [Planctomycetota bacterium]
MPKKKRKLDEFLSQRRKHPDAVLAERAELSHRILRFALRVALTGFLAFLAALARPPSRPSSPQYLVGLGALALLVLLFGWPFLDRVAGSSLERPSPFYRFVLLVLLTIGAEQFVLAMDWSPYLIPVPVFAMVAAMAYGQPTAFLASGAVAAFVGLTSPRLGMLPVEGPANASPGAFPFDVPLALVLFAGAQVSLLGVGRVRRQSRPVIVGAFAGAVQAVVVWACELMSAESNGEAFANAAVLSRILEDSSWAFGCGLVSGGFVTSLLPFIERAYDILTERRLLDLADPSNELLRVLREQAPGTYQHTLNVAQLAGNAAEAIGANRLLAEVGAYYHDVGKIFKPEYFVENMGEDRTIHERLRPSMSKMVIISHVKEGVELAREARLPEKIVDMIPMHHGTTVVEYFYRKAKQQAERSDQAESPDEGEYRYQCAKPAFREAGILMLADNVEAIAKSETEPTHTRFRALVHDLILKRLREGQLDESDLTMRDLHLVEESFVRTLTTMYHSRIKYPPGEPEEAKAGTEGPAGSGSPRNQKASP